MALRFYNTLTRKKEDFVPIDEKVVRIYTCGPTVYDYVHIGNLRAYVFPDILCRTLKYCGFKIKRVMNLTDIGHLSSDADSGEDKMTKGLRREGKTLTLENMRALAEFYAEKFKEDLLALNVEIPNNLYFASDYVKEDVDLVKKLEEKGYTYKIKDGIYFDTSKMPDYGVLHGGQTEWDKKGARINENPEKRNPEDFALWKFSAEGAAPTPARPCPSGRWAAGGGGQGSLPTGQAGASLGPLSGGASPLAGRASGNKIGFESPFGRGFPGWHIECSAMGMKFLGEQFDIHTGGIDLVPTHHTNEIAQSECATGKKPFVRFWMHNEHVDIGGAKMAKADGNFLKLTSLIEKDLDSMAYRFWLLMGHYRTKINFNWQALAGAETALKRLYNLYTELGKETGRVDSKYQQKFKEYIEDDLNTPGAVALLWDVTKDEKISDANKKATILDFDKVLGLGFENVKEERIPEGIIKLAEEREQARQNKDFKKSDELREKINSLGYKIRDTEDGYKINKIA